MRMVALPGFEPGSLGYGPDVEPFYYSANA